MLGIKIFEKGRVAYWGVFADEDGQQVNPLAYEPRTSQQQKCGATAATNTNMKKCSICQIVFYCSKECQKADWRRHKVDCRDPRPNA